MCTLIHVHRDNSINVWNLKMIIAYYKGTHSTLLKADWTTDPLIQPEFLASVETKLTNFFEDLNLDKAIRNYLVNGVYPDGLTGSTLLSPSMHSPVIQASQRTSNILFVR